MTGFSQHACTAAHSPIGSVVHSEQSQHSRMGQHCIASATPSASRPCAPTPTTVTHAWRGTPIEIVVGQC